MNQRVEKENEAVEVKPATELSVNSSNDIMDKMIKAAEHMDIEKLSRLMDLQERVMDRNAKMAFASALSAMQEEIPSIAENGAIVHKEGEKPRSKYATFEDINDAVKPVLQKHGFAISFRIKQDGAMLDITAILSHREGHSEETSMRMPADASGSKNAVQAMGSTVSYGKRYTMMALLNISSRSAGDKDDDAQSLDVIDTEQAAEIDTLIRSTKSNAKAFLGIFKVDDVRNIKAKDYDRAITLLNEKAKKVGSA